jgi:starch phosphorylase
MRIVHEYLRLIEDGTQPAVPRTYVFAGKAAPGYWAAKQIIKLINNVGSIINNDPRVKGLIKVVFVPDFRVSLAEVIIPGADLSEQISTAGSEASGTGNMKLALNGALTIGTLDGANVEILEAVGAENIFIFGLTADQIQAARANGSYRPRELCDRDPRLTRIVDAFDSNLFSPKEPGLFHWIVESLLDHGDAYFHLADLPAYLDAQRRVDDSFGRPAAWAAKATLNVARIGRFSSDRTIAEYASGIWGIAGIT